MSDGLVERLNALARHQARFGTGADDLREAADRIAALEKEVAELRISLFGRIRVTGSDHSTACSIWGDDGQGNTAENFAQPLPCNCGALENFAKRDSYARGREAGAKYHDGEAKKFYPGTPRNLDHQRDAVAIRAIPDEAVSGKRVEQPNPQGGDGNGASEAPDGDAPDRDGAAVREPRGEA